VVPNAQVTVGMSNTTKQGFITLDEVHMTLSNCGLAMDAATLGLMAGTGMFPPSAVATVPAAITTTVAGLSCDVSNATLYVLEGKCVEAALSAASTLPLIGGMAAKLTSKLPLFSYFGKVGVSKLQSISITESGLSHIRARHTINGVDSLGKSIFSEGVNLTELINKGQNVPRSLQLGGNYQRIVNADRIIGIDRTVGIETNTYTIITNSADELITAFPGRP
jgi:hypothetical protein